MSRPSTFEVDIPTLNELIEASDNLDNKTITDQTDYLVALAALRGQTEVRQMAAQLIPRHYAKFPTLLKESLAAQGSLLRDADSSVRLNAIKGLSNMTNLNADAIAVLLSALSDADMRISDAAKNAIQKGLENSEFRSDVYALLPSLRVESQNMLLELIKGSVQFTANDLPTLINLIQTGFKGPVFQALDLMSVNLKLFTNEQRDSLGNELLDRFESTVMVDFQSAVEQILPAIFKRSVTIGDPAAKRLIEIISKHVLPRIHLAKPIHQIEILRKLYNLVHLIDSPDVLEIVFKYVIMSFPNEGSVDKKCNFSIVEPALAAFHLIARRFQKAIPAVLGKRTVRTGQQDQIEYIVEDEGRYAAYLSRINFLGQTAKIFVDRLRELKEVIRADVTLTEEERRTKLNELNNGITTSNNCIHYCRILVEDNILASPPPARLSWKKAPLPIKKSQKSKIGARFSSRRR